MSLIKKQSNRTQIILVGILLLILVIGFFASLTTDGTSEPADGSAPEVSVETPAEKEPMNTTPALIGGAAAMVAYYLGSIAVKALKKDKKKEEKKDK